MPHIPREAFIVLLKENPEERTGNKSIGAGERIPYAQ